MSDTPAADELDVSRRDVLQSIPLGLALPSGLDHAVDGRALATDRAQIDSFEPPEERSPDRYVVDGSVRTTASDCLSLDAPNVEEIEVRRDLFGRLGEFSGELNLRDQLTEIPARHCDSALPPKYLPTHPRLAPIPAIHFDHYNSSVSDLAAPEPGGVDANLISHGLILGTCVNFLRDDEGGLYGFCGNLAP